jgi:hypothetical protein
MGITELRSACASFFSRPRDQFRQPHGLGVAVGGACGEDNGDRLREQAAGCEGERLRRGAVEPLGVVDQADQGLLLGGLGKQAEHR